jgi:LuxR family transcriptional regulator, quorum-sensing system regulator CinR
VIGQDKRRQRSLEAFSESIASTNTVSAALHLMRDYYGLTHVTYHLAQTVVGEVDAPFVRTTYPDRWVAQYLLKGYVAIDPIVRTGFRRSLAFDWSEVEIAFSDRPFLEDALRHGIGGQGYSIPVTDRANRRALLSVNSQLPIESWHVLRSRFGDEWIELGLLIHKIAVGELYGDADAIPVLARRELECLHWTALGKDQKDIALILGISEHTVRDYTKSARLKLGCATLSAAATRAKHLRLINPWPQTP